MTQEQEVKLSVIEPEDIDLLIELLEERAGALNLSILESGSETQEAEFRRQAEHVEKVIATLVILRPAEIKT